MSNRAYDLVRSLVEQQDGSMRYEREGYPHGAWVIRIGGRTKVFEADGLGAFPRLDGLYVPRVQKPKTWEDYSNELVPDADERLLKMLGLNPST